ncbi:hypothetical protein GCM10020000_51950 [Streptomyces olivoverticillatus]
MTGTGLCEEPSRSATLAALEARAKSGITVFDLDWRPVFWGGEGAAAPVAAARPYYAAALAHATVAVGNADECEVATGEREPHAAARALLAAGAELAVVKQGPKGVLAVHRDGAVAEVPPVAVEVLNGLGAGDGFGGALCHGLLAGWELERTVRFANAAGAIVASRLACSSAMPTYDEVAAVLGGRRRDRTHPGPGDGAGPASRGHRGGRGPAGPAPPHRRQRPPDDHCGGPHGAGRAGRGRAPAGDG